MMCERFSLTTDVPELAKQFRIDKVLTFYKPRYNVSPRQTIHAVITNGSERWLDEFRWGLVPFWGKDAINADSMMMDEKRAFKRIYVKNRCVIPSDGFYVWRTGEDGKTRQPMRIVTTNRRVFGMAGIYEVWASPQNDYEIRTCTVLTTAANRVVESMSDRMPVILDEEGIEQWLDPSLTDKNRLRFLLRPAPAETMRAYPVSQRVNSTDHEEPDCVEELDLRLPLLKI
ncbi:SOS response-associated peptidase [Paenibacillus chartarius]|uniref:Abasic site processing protein n=1 Tax=Paenibacillus chartarius TaxID=747481 RepID=A0ABV6DGM6_9BACL